MNKTIFSLQSSSLKYGLNNPKWRFSDCTWEISVAFILLWCRPIMVWGQCSGSLEIKSSGLCWPLWSIVSGVKLYSYWCQLEVASEKLEKYLSLLGCLGCLILSHLLHMHEDEQYLFVINTPDDSHGSEGDEVQGSVFMASCHPTYPHHPE